MAKVTYSGYGYGGPSASSYPAHNASSINFNDEFIHSMQTIVWDPSPVISANQFLDLVYRFLKRGGKPTLTIPEIRIGTAQLRDISCFEFVYRLFNYDIEGFWVDWDNAGVAINYHFKDIIRLCLYAVDERIEDPSLDLDEIIALIQCVQATDPYLANGKSTGNRILNLMEKFLERNGNPFLSIHNIKIDQTRLDKLTILELVYILWKLPMSTDLGKWQYVDEYESINRRFRTIIDRCLTVTNDMLSKNRVFQEDYLPLIRCAIEFSEDSESDELGPVNTDNKFFHLTANRFLDLMKHFVSRKVNPNLSFSEIRIGGNVYIHPTCLHVFYLLWRNPKAEWDELQEEKFQALFNKMLTDPRNDLKARFSERSLNVHHFVNSNNIEFYRKLHENNSHEKKIYSNGMYEPDERVIDQLDGHSLERVTIAHYAVALNDYPMLNRFLDLEPSLLNLTCCMTRGKATVDRERHMICSDRREEAPIRILEEDDQLSGNLVISTQCSFFDVKTHHIQVIRMTNVTLLHLAARAGHEGVLACLASRHPNPAITDSSHRLPKDYLVLSVWEGLVAKNRNSQMMFESLDLVVKYNRSTALPEVNRLIYHEGYDLLYNTSRKIAIFAHQRLNKDSFGEAKRTHHKWVENLMIPALNRPTDGDYKSSGFDRGHLAAAEDATGSDEKMRATFRLENAVPQDLSVNRGAWSRLESRVRDLAHENDLVEVFTGPLFIPEDHREGRVIKHIVIGSGEVHVPTHLFKIIFIHNHTTTREVYILPNHKLNAREKFTDYRHDDQINYIQQHSGILFNQWIRQ